MKLGKEIIIIFGLYYLGEVLRTICSIPLPGSLIGMIILLVLLQLHIVKLEHIATVSNFLLQHLPFFFIPAGVALMASFHYIKDVYILIIIICLLTTILTMGLSGLSIQKLMERKGKI